MEAARRQAEAKMPLGERLPFNEWALAVLVEAAGAGTQTSFPQESAGSSTTSTAHGKEKRSTKR